MRLQMRAEGVTSAATSMLTTFINAANASEGNLTSTFTTMMQAVLTTLTNYQTQFNTAGSTLMTKFISGIKSQDGNTKLQLPTLLAVCITAINNKADSVQYCRVRTLMIKLIAGVKSKDYETRNAFCKHLKFMPYSYREQVSGISKCRNAVHD